MTARERGSDNMGKGTHFAVEPGVDERNGQ